MLRFLCAECSEVFCFNAAFYDGNAVWSPITDFVVQSNLLMTGWAVDKENIQTAMAHLPLICAETNSDTHLSSTQYVCYGTIIAMHSSPLSDNWKLHNQPSP